MIEVQGVSKRYGSVEALKNISLKAPKGKVLGLLGQNGAGKTTLLNIMTGYLAPTAGRVLIDGRDPLLEPEIAKRELGYLPEHPPLYDEMTVEEYLHFVAALRLVTQRAIPAHVNEIILKTGLTEMRERLLGHLSKGYRQRVGLAQALCGDPDVLILDEPTVGLDPKQITEIRNLIRKLSVGRTIIFSSHILSEVRQLCDHVVILHRGEVKLDAPIGSIGGSDLVTLLCTVQGSEKRLVAAMNRLEGLRGVCVQPSSGEDEVCLQLSFGPAALPEKQVFTLCSAMSAPILRMTRCEDDLEQVFLRAISE
ncbi:MAG TPA: ABC transporter ATP-binding protein [Candidatus Limiplasma sp.]|nr:ABC transporter ATP-binding protein [Candidatus Limiplasma sp.]HPS82318.1 ABC transporter ATP-binding protein [Candidatus Limiplasma sp.]